MRSLTSANDSGPSTPTRCAIKRSLKIEESEVSSLTHLFLPRPTIFIRIDFLGLRFYIYPYFTPQFRD